MQPSRPTPPRIASRWLAIPTRARATRLSGVGERPGPACLASDQTVSHRSDDIHNGLAMLVEDLVGQRLGEYVRLHLVGGHEVELTVSTPVPC